MFQIIATLAVAVWFFRSARGIGKSGIGWALIGALVVFVPSIAWGIFFRIAIFPGLVQSKLEDTILTGAVLAVGSVGVIAGILLSVWVYRVNLLSVGVAAVAAKAPLDIPSRAATLPAYADRSIWIVPIAGAVILVIIILSPNSDADPLIIDAARRGDLHQVSVTLEFSGRWKEDRGPKGVTALIVASEGGHTEVVQKLLSAGADVDQRSEDGCTALVVASQRGHQAAVEALLSARPDVDAACNDGRRALTAARTSGYTGIAGLLRSAGAIE